jgi:hypothetical protein
LVPAAAVIPTPIVYLNFAAVKKLVVEFLAVWESQKTTRRSSAWRGLVYVKVYPDEPAFYFEEIRVFLAGLA